MDAIGRMTPADYEATAHRERTAQVRIAGRRSRLHLVAIGMLIPNPFTRRHRPHPKMWRGIYPKTAPLELVPSGINE